MRTVEVFISSLFCGRLTPNILCAPNLIEVGKLPVDDDRVWRGLVPVATALLVTTATENKKTTLGKNSVQQAIFDMTPCFCIYWA